MKAMVIERFGGPDVFRATDVPKPELKPGHVLIKVAGSSVNPIDTKIRSGAVPALASGFPAVLHGDVAGTIEAVGEGVRSLQPGDQVYGFAGGVKGFGGALAEYMLADADLLARAPRSLSLVDAAALPIVGLTAWEAVVERARVRPAQQVLVHAGTGGVGHLALQLARCAGATVCTTVSSEAKATLARELGANAVVNYHQQPVADYVAHHTGGDGFDIVIDTVGGDCLAASFQAVKSGGVVVTIAARSTQDLTPLHGKGATLHVVFALLRLLQTNGRERQQQILTDLARLIDSGRVRPLFDPESFHFKDVAAAHRKLEAGRAVGKIRLAADWPPRREI